MYVNTGLPLLYAQYCTTTGNRDYTRAKIISCSLFPICITHAAKYFRPLKRVSLNPSHSVTASKFHAHVYDSGCWSNPQFTFFSPSQCLTFCLKECSRHGTSDDHLSSPSRLLLLRLHPLRSRQAVPCLPQKLHQHVSQTMHPTTLLPLLLASVISANPILLPSVTIPISSTTAVSVPAGHPSSLTASILSGLQSYSGSVSTVALPSLVSVSVEYVGVPVPTLGSVSLQSVSMSSIGVSSISPLQPSPRSASHQEAFLLSAFHQAH